MRKEVVFCDICNDQIIQESTIAPPPKQYQIIFTTEQTEGRSCKPYIQNHTLDVCPKCEEKILTGHVLYGEGAMGYNHYSFK